MSIRQFFTVKSQSVTTRKRSIGETEQIFKPFLLKQGMKLAPTVRRQPLTTEDKENLDACILSPEGTNAQILYLDELRGGVHTPRKSKRTLSPLPEIIVPNDEAASNANVQKKKIRRKKLLQFNENRRPSKYGYWFRRSRKITGRKPVAKDVDAVDYDVDSDDEWEDEADGDDCKSDDEDEEKENEEELDDEDKSFFVEHGYLSASENASDEDDGDPESRHERGKVKMITFQAEMEARKKKSLQLISIGPLDPSSNDAGDVNLLQLLDDFNAVTVLSSIRPIPTSFTPEVRKSAPSRPFTATKTPRSVKKTSNEKTPKSEKTSKSEKKVSLKRKLQDTGDNIQHNKREVLNITLP